MKHAQSDLELAKLGRKSKMVMNEQICFHSQQCAEKAVKAVLLFKEIDFPLTHDLEELLDILENSGIKLISMLTEAGKLTPYAVETRYPGYWGDLTNEDADESIELAEKILKWASKYILS
ncbi:MAG: HEPN domain-containing protein [Candidatus Schekmanbacteria bacterium]|nr:HEPN domain-containing protein [Candidatus Schekmanbacteria bacterium]